MNDKHIIYNDDFETVIWGNMPESAQELAELYYRVRGTGVTSYAVKVAEFDNKIYYDTKCGIDWAKIDFNSYGSHWDSYATMARLLLKLRDEGTEALKVCVDSCRDMDIEPIATFRMNDCHGMIPLDTPNNADISFILKKHPEYAITRPGTGERVRIADFRHQFIRDYRLAIIKEAVEKFDFDGVEMDFMRSATYFSPDRYAGMYGFISERRFAELAPLLTDMVCQLRRYLDELATRKGKQRLRLGVRVPETLQAARQCGFDVPTWVRDARLDYICPTGYQATNHNMPVEEYRRLCDGTNCEIYPSLFPMPSARPRVMATIATEVWAATAQTYFRGGANGVSLFNHFHAATKQWGKFNDDALHLLGSSQKVAEAKHHYFISHPADTKVPVEDANAHSGFHGALASSTGYRGVFPFRFGEDLNATGRQVHKARIKVLEMTPDDEVFIDLNATPIPFRTEWRRREVKGTELAEGRWQPTIEGWDGEAIEGAAVAETLTYLKDPSFRRNEYVQAGDIGKGWDVFMLVHLDEATVAKALLPGENDLGVTVLKRRDDALFELYARELEIVVGGAG